MLHSVSDTPIKAPADYRTREESYKDDLPWSEERTGPGWPTERACAACGNSQGNLCIFYYYWCSRNGDGTENHEIWCSRCQKYSLYVTSL
jgi:hypothetical protein